MGKTQLTQLLNYQNYQNTIKVKPQHFLGFLFSTLSSLHSTFPKNQIKQKIQAWKENRFKLGHPSPFIFPHFLGMQTALSKQQNLFFFLKKHKKGPNLLNI